MKKKTSIQKLKNHIRIPRSGIIGSEAVRRLTLIDSSGTSDVRGTPPDIYMKVLKQLNYYPKMDYAGDALHHMCQDYITKEKDTFSLDWILNGFLNPEYANIELYLAYAVDMWKTYDINLLVLTYSKTGRGWWHRHIEPYRQSGEADVIFYEGRLIFTDELGWKMDNNSTDDSAFIFYKSKLFPHETFCPFPFY